MWDFIINPFITVIAFLYSVFGNNIVLAIAVFTVIVRLATSPLILQQQRSTEAMRELQPQIEKLKEKYKNDREKFAAAQMELYREKGINPLGGCFPLLVQMPIIFGLYGAIIQVLGSTPYQVIDLAGRFMIPGLDNLIPLDKLWLGFDLTKAPTVYIDINPLILSLPLLVAATTWLQSKLTMPPVSDDDKNNPTASMTRTMITVMPVMFGFFALSFPIGLSIYFLVSNIVGIVQYTLLGKADWRRLLGLPPKEEPDTSKDKTKHLEDDPVLMRVTQKVEEKSQEQAKELNIDKSVAGTSRVLSANPSTTPKDGTFNSSGASKRKKRKKK